MLTVVMRTSFRANIITHEVYPMGITNQNTEFTIIILAFAAHEMVPALASLAPLPRDGNVDSTYTAPLHPGFALRCHLKLPGCSSSSSAAPGEVDLAALEGEHTHAEPAKQ